MTAKSYSTQSLKIQTSLQHIALKKNPGTTVPPYLYLLFIYPLPQHQFDQNLISSSFAPFIHIISGDFNAHSPTWEVPS